MASTSEVRIGCLPNRKQGHKQPPKASPSSQQGHLPSSQQCHNPSSQQGHLQPMCCRAGRTGKKSIGSQTRRPEGICSSSSSSHQASSSSNPARQAEARPPHNPFSTGWKNKLARFIHSYESGQWAICDKWAKTYQEEVQEHYNTFGQPPQTGKPVWIQKTSWLMEAYLKGNWNRC